MCIDVWAIKKLLMWTTSCEEYFELQLRWMPSHRINIFFSSCPYERERSQNSLAKGVNWGRRKLCFQLTISYSFFDSSFLPLANRQVNVTVFFCKLRFYFFPSSYISLCALSSYITIYLYWLVCVSVFFYLFFIHINPNKFFCFVFFFFAWLTCNIFTSTRLYSVFDQYLFVNV